MLSHHQSRIQLPVPSSMEELYTLEREVGRGSYGVVFEGHMSKTGQRVAIKRLPCGSPECIELYLQELWAMRATAQNHPNVITLHDCLLQTGPRTLQPLKPQKLPVDLVESVLKGSVVGAPESTEDKLQDETTTVVNLPPQQRPLGRPRKRPAQSGDAGEEERRAEGAPRRCSALWLVMEYCDGGDLNHYLLSRPPDGRRDHSIVLQLSGALAFLHGLGITHRDLKPDNVLVCLAPDGPVIKVADFGLSKMSGCGAGGGAGPLTRQYFSSTCGSDFYMAPEVWGGLSYTAQADIFSLGVMFWAVLERLTFVEEGTTQEQLGGYVWKAGSGWLVPLGEALCENPKLRLSIPMKGRSRRAPPLPPPPGPATSLLLLDMLACDPDARPTAGQLEARVRSAAKEDGCWATD